MDPTDDLLSEGLRQLKPSMEEEPEGLSWMDEPLHGMYQRQIEEVADIGMAGKIWIERQHRGTDHSCPRAGPKHKMDKRLGSTTPDRTPDVGCTKTC